ncbi:MAG: iron ABC transporter permease, partial [Clostridium sp.]
MINKNRSEKEKKIIKTKVNMKKQEGIKKVYIIASIVFLSLGMLYALNVGSVSLSFGDMIKGLCSGVTEGNIGVIKEIRMPRVFSAVLIGGNLAVAGVLLQAVIRNPLADPYITGISSGASFVTVIIMMFFPAINMARPLFGFMGGSVSCAIVYVFAFKKELSPIRIVLVGAAVNALFGGITSLLTTSSGIGGSAVSRWLTGSLATVKVMDLKILFIYTIIGMTGAIMVTRSCNILSLGRKNARSLGINPDFHMILITAVAVFLSSVSTSIGGIISFIGLVVPHMCRIIIGSEHKYLIPFSAVMGGALLLTADTLGRILMKPVEIPVGIIMSVIGAPFFLYLLR